VERAVDLHAHEPTRTQLVEQLLELALAMDDERRGDRVFVFSPSANTSRTISSVVRPRTGLPQVGQRWVPVRAYSTRR
jgi:hypothetical protein